MALVRPRRGSDSAPPAPFNRGAIMSGSVNRVTLIGNLGRDPEARIAQDGSKIVTLNLATSESWTGKDGTKQEKSEWHRIVIFNDRVADVAEKYLKKGSKCYVEGQLQTRKWTDQSGQEKYSTEIVIGKFRGELTLLDAAKSAVQQQAKADPELDEDVPF